MRHIYCVLGPISGQGTNFLSNCDQYSDMTKPAFLRRLVEGEVAPPGRHATVLLQGYLNGRAAFADFPLGYRTPAGLQA